jgi:hypothetical protein
MPRPVQPRGSEGPPVPRVPRRLDGSRSRPGRRLAGGRTKWPRARGPAAGGQPGHGARGHAGGSVTHAVHGAAESLPAERASESTGDLKPKAATPRLPLDTRTAPPSSRKSPLAPRPEFQRHGLSASAGRSLGPERNAFPSANLTRGRSIRYTHARFQVGSGLGWSQHIWTGSSSSDAPRRPVSWPSGAFVLSVAAWGGR